MGQHKSLGNHNFSFQILIPLKIEKFQIKYDAKENIIRHFKYSVSPNEAHIYK